MQLLLQMSVSFLYILLHHNVPKLPCCCSVSQHQCIQLHVKSDC